MKKRVSEIGAAVLIILFLYLAKRYALGDLLEDLGSMKTGYRLPLKTEKSLSVSENRMEVSLEDARNTNPDEILEKLRIFDVKDTSGTSAEENGDILEKEETPARTEEADAADPAGEVLESGGKEDTGEVAGEVAGEDTGGAAADDPEAGEGEDTSPGSQKPTYPISVDGFLVDENRMIVGVDPDALAIEAGCLYLPSENCTGIRKDAFASCTRSIVEIYIPSNICVIEEGSFAGIPDLEWLEILPGNPSYVTENGVIFDASGSVLLAAPSARTGTYEAPASLTRIGDYAFDLTRLSGIDMRKCGAVELGEYVFGDGNVSGMVIAFREDWEAYYRELFVSYDVEIKGYKK